MVDKLSKTFIPKLHKCEMSFHRQKYYFVFTFLFKQIFFSRLMTLNFTLGLNFMVENELIDEIIEFFAFLI